MRWKLLMVLAVAAGGVAWAARRRVERDRADAELWAEATDPLSPGRS